LRYFLVSVNSDLNPTNGAIGDAAVDAYNDSSSNNVIAFQEVDLINVNVLAGNQIFRIFENGSACSGFDIGFQEIKQYLDGTAIGHNQNAFSFTFTNALLPMLLPNSDLQVTVNVDVEVIYADQSRKKNVS